MKGLLYATCLTLATLSAPALAADAAAGKEKSQTCAACHGADGNSQAPDFPRLAGQHFDYLVHSILSYKNGRRKNAIMTPQVEKLSLRDIEDLAAYFSQQSGLHTPHLAPVLPR